MILLTQAGSAGLPDNPLPDHVSTLLKPVSLSRLEALISLKEGNPGSWQQQLSQSRKILAVDDNPVNLKLLKTILTNLGQQVSTAENGFEAIELCRHRPFDLIFMDVQMPGLDGIEATRKIRQLDHPNQRVPVVAVTAHALPEEKKKLLQSGFDDYMSKPVSEKLLITMINQWTHHPASPKQSAIKPVHKSPEHTRKALSISESETHIRAAREDSPANVDLAVRLASGRHELAMEMLVMLKEGLADDLITLRQGWKNNNFAAVLERVHRLHGACRYCGVPELEKICDRLETRLKKHNTLHQSNITEDFHLLLKAILRLQTWEVETEPA